ncbi:MAG: hypothetical protein KC931_07310, partial [Candidatus Omnitrophica bacterium]|nr:hypothetical protein [Candidatus Omnitrophota bacterium]
MIPSRYLFPIIILPALLQGFLPTRSLSQDLGTVSGAARSILLDTEFDFKGPGTESCGSEIPDASGGEPPAFPLNFPDSMASGVLNYLPALQLLDATTETTISIQNLGNMDCVPVVLFSNADDPGDFVPECGGLLEPGSSFTFQPASIPPRSDFAVVLSLAADFMADASDIIDYCEFFQRLAMQKIVESKGGGFEELGPNLAVQVRRSPVTQSETTPVVSTAYPGVNERMFEIVDFQGAVKEGPFRYEVNRVFTTDDAETEIHIVPYSPFFGVGTKGAPGNNNYRSTFTDEITGATTEGPSGVLVQGRAFDFKISDSVGESFAGSWIIDSSQPLAIVADFAYPNSRFSSVLGVRSSEIPGFTIRSRSAWAPLLQEPGWETEVTVKNLNDLNLNPIVLELKDSLGNNLDQREVTLDVSETRTITFSPSLLVTESQAGILFIHSDQEFYGQIRQVKRGPGGEVLDVLSYNLIEEDVSVDADTYFDLDNKGSSPDEEGGAEVLAIPFLEKSNPSTGLETEILLTNLNPLPGLTAANLYLYDNAGLRDIQCFLLRPLETLLIPVDFPSLGGGAIASAVIRGTSTSQKVLRNNGEIYNTMAFAAIAIQRSKTPPSPEPDSDVDLASGGNDAAMASGGVFYPIASAGVGDTLFFPSLNHGGTVPGASDSLTVQPIDFGTLCRVGVLFLGSEEVLGSVVSDPIEFPQTFVVEDSQIPPDANCAVAFSFDPADATTIARFTDLESVGRYAAFLRDYRDEEGILPSISIFGLAQRNSPSALNPEKRVLTAYEAHRSRFGGREDTVFGGWNVVVPLILTGEGFDTVVSIQNSGLFATPVELTFVRESSPKSEPTIKSLKNLKSSEKGLGRFSNSAASGQTIRLDLLQPGTSQSIRPADHVGKDFRGKLLIRTTGPVVATADLESGGTLSTYNSIPDELITGDLGSDPAFTRGSKVAYGPLVYPSEEGWETVIQVLNLNRLLDSKVRVDFYTSGGNNTHTQTGFVPPGGVASFRRSPSLFDLNDNPTVAGWVQITSEDFWHEGSPAVPAANILAVIQLNKKNSLGCLLESVAYNAYAERGLFNYPGNELGFPLQLGFPTVFKDFSEYETSTEIALVNLNPNSGTTTLTNVTFNGDGFSTTLSDILLDPREARLLKTLDLPGIPSGVEGSLSLDASVLDSFQNGGPGVAGIAVHRAYGLLPNDECAAVQVTETATATPTSTESVVETATLTPTLTPSETPTGTPPTATPTDTMG